jgi:hypothetical protein
MSQRSHWQFPRRPGHSSSRRYLSRLALFCLPLAFWPLLCPPPAGADEIIVLPYLSTGYRYRVVSFGAGAGFERREFDDTGFALGSAAFGAATGCPLDSTITTPWPPNTDLLLRKWFTLPADVKAVKVAVAIDNDLQVFINGIELTHGLERSDDCAVRDRFVYPVPDDLLIPGGQNLLALRARDRGLATYCDVEIRSGLPQALDPRAIVYTLRSGNNAIGGPDPLVWVQGSAVPLFGVIDSGLPLQQAFVVDRLPTWGFVEGASWVSPTRLAGGFPEGYEYFTLFALPPGFRSARLDVVWRGDDGAELALNGFRLPTPWGHFSPSVPPGEFHGEVLPYLVPGMNRLQFFTSNARLGFNPTGISFFARLTLTPW